MMRWSEIPQDTAVESAGAVVVNAASQGALLNDLGARMAAGQGFCVATLNLDHVAKLRHLPEFREAYLRQTHVTADGNPIVWLSRLAGQDVSLVPGSELIDPVAELAARHDVSVALLGATDVSLRAAADALRTRHPGLRIAAMIAPPMGFDPAGELAQTYIEELGACGAGLCFVALGAPKQEIFAARAHDALPHTGFLSIGAGLDFISGSQVRAPKIVRRFAAEWLWRLGSDPRRLAARYGACIVILPGLLQRALRARFRTDPGAS